MEVDRLKLIPLDTERSSQNSVKEADANETETAEFRSLPIQPNLKNEGYANCYCPIVLHFRLPSVS